MLGTNETIRKLNRYNQDWGGFKFSLIKGYRYIGKRRHISRLS